MADFIVKPQFFIGPTLGENLTSNKANGILKKVM